MGGDVLIVKHFKLLNLFNFINKFCCNIAKKLSEKKDRRYSSHFIKSKKK